MSKFHRHNFYEAAIDDVKIKWEIEKIERDTKTDIPTRIHWICIAYLGDNEMHKMRTRGKTDVPETVKMIWAKTNEYEDMTERHLFFVLFNWCNLDRKKIETKAKEHYVVFYCRAVEETLPEVQYETPENAAEVNWNYLKWLQETYKNHYEYVYVLWGCLNEEMPFAVYVGRTWNIFDRLCQHKNKPYWHFVQDIWFEGYTGKPQYLSKPQTQADDIEYDLIQKLKPVFNKQVNGRTKIKSPSRPFRHMKDMYEYLLSKSDQMHGDHVYNHIVKTDHMIETKVIL